MKSRPFLDWVATLPCSTCGAYGIEHDNGSRYNHPSHIKSRGAGGSDLGNVIPQCYKCHAKFHQYGILTFQKKFDVNLNKLSKRYVDKWVHLDDEQIEQS